MDIRTQKIKESLLDPNDGQLDGLPSNPRKWSEEELENLKKSILETPELLEARGIIVVPNNERYIVLGGNMRLAALRSLGWTDIPCIVLPENTPAEKLREIVIKDNGSFGEWDTSMLAADWSDLPLDSWGVDADWSVDAEAAVSDESAEEDDFDESTDIVETRCKLGELWELGAHRLMCGDSTDTQVLEALMGGVLADMYLTDPPYNVDYTGGTKDMLKIANDSMPDEKFKTFLTAAFTTANKHLKAGGAFYIWHADSEGFNFRYAVKACGWLLKQNLIWNKNTFVLGRQDYQWKHEPCQPAGTKVRTPNGEIPIEELKDGDRVISYDKYAGVIKGYKDGLAIKTASRHYTGDIYGIEVGDRKTWATDNHRFTVRFHDAGRKIWCVYLMKRGAWWRVGITETYNSRGFGLKQRMRQENADEAWILKTFNTRAEAQCYEQIAAVKYGIPYTYWEVDSKPVPSGYVIRTKEQIEWIYSHFDAYELRGKAETLLRAFGRKIEYPLITRGNRDHHLSTRVTTDVRACNLIPHIMELPIPYDKYEGTHTFEWKPITEVERKAYDGTVYSLKVEKYEHYIADGIVTHNCLYGWKSGAAHYFVDIHNYTTVFEDSKSIDINSMKKQELKELCARLLQTNIPTTVIDERRPSVSAEHPTMKPVRLMGRLISNSSRPGEIVLDTFGGSGTTLIACEQLGRKCRMVELDPHYCDVIIARWEKLTGQKAVKMS